MSDRDWETPEAEDDPDFATLARDDDGGARLVPGGIIVEGELDDGGGDAGGVDPELGRDR